MVIMKRGTFMRLMRHKKKQQKTNRLEWKETNQSYLDQLQKFLDVADNIQNEDLRKRVILEMLKCDFILTELAEKEFCKYQKAQINE